MAAIDSAQQETVVEWFDSVYQRKGKRYLRPESAYLVFLELLGVRPEHRLLDVACGPGVMLSAASRYTRQLFGIDISHVAIEQARMARVPADLRCGNAQRLPYDDQSFDRISCLGSLERMLNRPKALAEMRRVGTGDARYCFLVRNSSTFAWQRLGFLAHRQRAAGHADADTLEGWTRLFESNSFRILDVLPDQYPLHRRRRRASLYLRPASFRTPLRPTTPIDRANEFVFILGKRS